VLDVVTVQNLYNVGKRQSEALLDYCEKEQVDSSHGSRSEHDRSTPMTTPSVRWLRG
jgi:diketogulonate reductase-like aldo/keto reductase